jgi:hypothetical protein
MTEKKEIEKQIIDKTKGDGFLPIADGFIVAQNEVLKIVKKLDDKYCICQNQFGHYHKILIDETEIKDDNDIIELDEEGNEVKKDVADKPKCYVRDARKILSANKFRNMQEIIEFRDFLNEIIDSQKK